MIKTLSLSLMLSLFAFAAQADSKEVYDKECSKCHGKDGKGQTVMGKKQGAKDYTDAKVQEAVTDDAVAKAVKNGFKDKDGKTLMKPTEGLTDADIKGLVTYMRSFKK